MVAFARRGGGDRGAAGNTVVAIGARDFRRPKKQRRAQVRNQHAACHGEGIGRGSGAINDTRRALATQTDEVNGLMLEAKKLETVKALVAERQRIQQEVEEWKQRFPELFSGN